MPAERLPSINLTLKRSYVTALVAKLTLRISMRVCGRHFGCEGSRVFQTAVVAAVGYVGGPGSPGGD